MGSSVHLAQPTKPDVSTPHDEHNTPFSVDWAVVLRWLLDRTFLGSAPAHDLLTDASHLPRVNTRFFKADKTWIDCLVGGALCLSWEPQRSRGRLRPQRHQGRRLPHDTSYLGYKSW